MLGAPLEGLGPGNDAGRELRDDFEGAQDTQSKGNGHHAEQDEAGLEEEGDGSAIEEVHMFLLF